MADTSDAPFPATDRIAEFVSTLAYADIPPAVIESGKAHFLDALGLGLAGAVAPGSRIIRGYLEELGLGGSGAVVIGTGLRMAPRFAALANGAAMHAHCYDDTTPQHRPDRNGGVHASGCATATALAVGEVAGASGKALMEAYHAAVEVASRLNHAIDNRHYGGGFHATGTINVFAAAAAASRLLGLDAPTTRTALGIAASQSSGVRENFGTMTNPFHPGHAAECGIVAAELASRGFTAAPDALEAPRGFFAAAGGGFDPGPLVDGLGRPWAFEDPGIWLKPYPCGALMHPAMKVLARMREEGGLAPGDIRRVRIRTNRKIANILLHDRPTDWLQAKFSMPFCAAAILVRGRAGLNEFNDEFVNAPEVKAMMAKIDYGAYDRIEADHTNTTTFVEVEPARGPALAERVDYPKGSPRDPMSFEEVADKFRECAEYAAWPSARADDAIAMVRQIENVTNASELSALFGACRLRH